MESLLPVRMYSHWVKCWTTPEKSDKIQAALVLDKHLDCKIKACLLIWGMGNLFRVVAQQEESSCSGAGCKGALHCHHTEGESVPTSLSSAQSSHQWWHLYNWGHHLHALPVSGCFPKVLPGQGPHLGTLEHVYCPVPLSRTAGKSTTVLRCRTEASVTPETCHNITFSLWLPVQKTVRLVRNMPYPSCPGKVSRTSQKPLKARRSREGKVLLTNSNWSILSVKPPTKNKIKDILLCIEYLFSINKFKTIQIKAVLFYQDKD